MKKDVSPSVFIGIVATIVVVVAAICVWVFRAPSAAPAASGAGATTAGAANRQRVDAEMKEAHGPTQDQMKQIEEWKKSHPGASTKY